MQRESSPDDFEEVIDRKGCRFIDGDVKKKTATYCPNPALEKSPYCQEHRDRCFIGQWKNPEKILDDL